MFAELRHAAWTTEQTRGSRAATKEKHEDPPVYVRLIRARNVSVEQVPDLHTDHHTVAPTEVATSANPGPVAHTAGVSSSLRPGGVKKIQISTNVNMHLRQMQM